MWGHTDVAARILIMAGGTGGHVFPAIAVARELRAEGAESLWLGTRAGLEADVVPRAGFELATVAIGGLRGKGLLRWLSLPFRLAWAMLQSLQIILRFRPMAVLGMGGFAAGPGGLMTWLLRKPLLVHEQNAVAGLTNRWLAVLADRCMMAFPGALPARLHPQLIGNPVRAEIAALPEPGDRMRGRTGPLRLLVLGGSQGARALNRRLPAAIAALPESIRPEVRHQAGRTLDEAIEAYREAGVSADCIDFIDDVAAAYAWADFVVARAGALTVSELAAAGLGAILVPYPHAIDDHQMKNAEVLQRAEAAVVLPEAELETVRLQQELARILSDRVLVGRMGQRCHALMTGDAALRLADACAELAEAGR
jgi:UDP-N-acetylglucosamine--N-acetylmuramyl-(pentapeptide) pyrophosphoryl-undecaprenol N-acetylglucosamine transferase